MKQGSRFVLSLLLLLMSSSTLTKKSFTPSRINKTISINNEIFLIEKLIKLKNSSKSDQSWLIDYKQLYSFIHSQPNVITINLLLLAEQRSLARPRNLEFVIKTDKDFNFNFYENKSEIIPSHTLTINKCSPWVNSKNLENITINLDTKPDVQYGNVIDRNVNTSKNRGGTKKYPQLKSKVQFKLLIQDPVFKEKFVLYFINIFLTTWQQHFNDILKNDQVDCRKLY